MSHPILARGVLALCCVLIAGGCAKREGAEAPAAVATAPEPAPMAVEIVERKPAEAAAGDDLDDMLSALDGAPAGRAAPAAPPPPPAQGYAEGTAAIDQRLLDEQLTETRARRPAPARRIVVEESADAPAKAKKKLRIELAADGLFGDDDRPMKAAKLATKDAEGGEALDADKKPREAEKREAADEAEEGEASKGDRGRGPANRGEHGRGGKFGRFDPADALVDEDQTVTPDRFAEMLTGLDERSRDGRRVELAPADPDRYVEPASTLPRSFYFENTYLGGNAAYAERLRRLDDALGPAPRPYRRAALPGQPFDAPTDAGLALTAALDQTSIDRPQRVHLQIGLQGSRRYGWRRPPLDVVLVVDASAIDAGHETLIRAVTELMRRLGPQDRLGVVLAGRPPRVLAAPAAVRDLRAVLARQIEALTEPPAAAPDALAAAMREAGAALAAAAGDQARIPGSGTVLVLTAAADPARVAAATEAAHALTVQGATTSVIALGGASGWWPVANAGHGNDHRATPETLGAAIDAELQSISRVIARLLRVNIRLAPGVEAIRILGSRQLDEQEVRQVKAREEATDRNLSKTMGVKADRGADDDGIQTVIPYFYGGDSHVILVELWVTRPGPVAEVTLKYKDMVALDNATARAAAQLDRVPRPLGPIERRVAGNVRGFHLAEGLAAAARHRDAGSMLDALDALDPLARGPDAAVLDGFEALVRQRGADPTVAEALRMARDRRIGHFEQ
ncbi:MAG: hypothetical protein R3F65_24235 [bacterium]